MHERTAVSGHRRSAALADSQKKWFANQIATLKLLFEQRNALAHGIESANVAFELIFDRLDTIQQKWIDVAKDFRGY